MKPWPLRPVGDLLERVVKPVKVEPGREYREIGIRSHCRGIFHKPPVLGQRLGSKRVYWVEPGCLTFNIIFAWEQAVAMTTTAEQGMIASHRFPMFRAINGDLIPEYAYLYFSSPRGKYALGIASPGGAGRNKTLGQEEFARLEIPLPPPAFQRLAIDLAATWKRGIAQLSALIDRKVQFKRGIMQKVLMSRIRFEGHSSSGSRVRLPRGWSEVRLGDVVNILFSGVDKLSAKGETPVRLCNYTDVYKNDYITPRLTFMRATASTGEIEKFGLKKGDVIITKDSETPDDIAKPATVTDDMPDVICGYHLAILRPKAGVDGFFLGKALVLPRTRHEFYRIANGATRYGLTYSSVANIPLILPSEREQRKIGAAFYSLDEELSLLVHERNLIEQQRRALLQHVLQERGQQ